MSAPAHSLDHWRMESPCVDCPFNTDGPGFELRLSLGPGRWRGIIADLRRGHHFLCHKTTSGVEEDEEVSASALICAGSIAWEDARGMQSDLRQILTRLAR